jgi:hypothetical protein
MRFYQFEYRELITDKVSGVQVEVPHREWFGSEREAVIRRLELFKAGKLAGKKKDNEIWPVDVPTDKQSLLAWLRKECV